MNVIDHVVIFAIFIEDKFNLFVSLFLNLDLYEFSHGCFKMTRSKLEVAIR